MATPPVTKPPGPYRIVLTGERSPYCSSLSAALASLGNPVLRREFRTGGAANEVGEDDSGLVVVVVAGDDRTESLRLIGVIRHQAHLPVVAAIERDDMEWTTAAVAAGASGAVVGAETESLRAAVHVACEHFAELRRLEEALERRAVIERAKGVLMATHGIRGEDAYVLLRDHSKRKSRSLFKIADAVLKSHVLLGRQPRTDAAEAPATADAGFRLHSPSRT
jgi:response regulator NasT